MLSDIGRSNSFRQESDKSKDEKKVAPKKGH